MICAARALLRVPWTTAPACLFHSATAGLSLIEKQFDAGVDAIDGASWWYDNVHDLSGQHLLNWWSTA